MADVDTDHIGRSARETVAAVSLTAAEAMTNSAVYAFGSTN